MPNQKSLDKILILDRDGVINQDSDDFIKSPDEWLPIESSLEAIARLTKAGYHIFVLSNQSGIARGYFSLEILSEIHEKMHTLVESHGGKIHHVFFCPHGPHDDCDCRKPKAGLYDQLASHLNSYTSYSPLASPVDSELNQANLFDKTHSIGDSIRDLQAAVTAGAKPVLVRTGKGIKSEALLDENQLAGTLTFDNLASYTDWLLN
jgi:D-glycero-D-manno-heptose 1,7-bisphosphate phosphatase